MAKKIETFDVDGWSVKNVRKLDFGTFFTLELPGLSLYNMRVVPAGEKYDAFITPPEVKGKDGNYYKQFYIALDKADQEAIIAEVDAILEEEFEKEKSKGRKARK
jgi:hypothetical protein